MAEHENPEHQKSVTPGKEIVTEAYSDVLKHNKEYTGFGALFGNLLKTTLLKSEVVEDNTNGGGKLPDYLQVGFGANDDYGSTETEDESALAPKDIVTEGDMSAALQDVFHNDTFTRIGINMGQFGSYITGPEDTPVTSKEVVPIITNQSLYTEFLGTLDTSDTDDKQTRKLLGDVIANLDAVVSFAFADESINAMSPDERTRLAEAGEDTLRTFVAIDDEYSRLGVDAAGLTERTTQISSELQAALDEGLQYKYGALTAELRKEYDELQETKKQAKVYASLSRKVDYWGRNILTEGIIADKEEYLVPPAEQGFGPAHWHEDGGQRHWAAAFGFLNQMQDSDRTKEFGAEVKQGLLKSLDTALETIDTSDEELYYSGQKADLENVRAAINGDEFDTQKFIDYTSPRK